MLTADWLADYCYTSIGVISGFATGMFHFRCGVWVATEAARRRKIWSARYAGKQF